MSRTSVPLLLLASMLLAACQTDSVGVDQTESMIDSQPNQNKEQPAPTGGGILLAAWARDDVAARMTEADRRHNQHAESRACYAPVGQMVTWNNPDSGHSGTIVAVSDGYADNGAYCREFRQTVAIRGQRKQGYAKACQQPDGSWKIAP
ncbi:MAG: RT0821/Lpp0805 family surface protein [Alphaproteobacteria bacterium]|nr:RT0821/Lpp0805 family surface protein [Alphaproteobacteria bacterium]